MKLHVVPALYAIWVSSQPITSLATSREVWPAGEGGGWVGWGLYSILSAPPLLHSHKTPPGVLCVPNIRKTWTCSRGSGRWGGRGGRHGEK